MCSYLLIHLLSTQKNRPLIVFKRWTAEFDSLVAESKKIRSTQKSTSYSGDPDENRTRVTAVKGRCLDRLTTGPYLVAAVGLEPTTFRV